MTFVTMATNLASCFFIQFLEQLLKLLVNFTFLKYIKSQRSYDFLIRKELIFGFQLLDFKDHFSASLCTYSVQMISCVTLSHGPFPFGVHIRQSLLSQDAFLKGFDF